jgi:hypothetical protein
MSFDVVDLRQRSARAAKSPSRRLPSNADGFVVCSDCGAPFGGGCGGGGGDNCCGAPTASFDGGAPPRSNRNAGVEFAVAGGSRHRSEMPTRNSTAAIGSKNRSRSVEGRSAVDVRVDDYYAAFGDANAVSERAHFASASGIRSTADAARNVPPPVTAAAGTRQMPPATAPQPQWDGISVWVPNTSMATAASTAAGRRTAKSRLQQTQMRSTSTLSASHETDMARRRQSAITISGGERRCVVHQLDVPFSRTDATGRHQTGGCPSQSVSAVSQPHQQMRWNGGQSVSVACHLVEPMGNGGVVVGDGGNPTEAIPRRLYDGHTAPCAAMKPEPVECRTRHANLPTASSVAGNALESSFAVWRMRPSSDDVRVSRKNASCVRCCARHHVDRHATIAGAVASSPWSSADRVAGPNETESCKRSERSRQTDGRITMRSSGAFSIDNGFDLSSECVQTIVGGSCGNVGELRNRTSTSDRPLSQQQQQQQQQQPSHRRDADESVGSIVAGSGRSRASGTSDDRQECDATVAAADGGGQPAVELINANEAINTRNLMSEEASCINVARQKPTSEIRTVGVNSSNIVGGPLSNEVTDDATDDDGQAAAGGRDNPGQNLQLERALHPPRPPPRHESTSLCHSGTVGSKRAPAPEKSVDSKRGDVHANTLSPEEILNWKLSLMTCTDGENAGHQQQWNDGTSSASVVDAAYANMPSDDDDDDDDSDCNNAVNSETGNDVVNIGSPSANGGGSCVTCCNVSIFSFEDNFERALEEPCACSAADDGYGDADTANDVNVRQSADAGDEFEMQMDDLLIRRIDGVFLVDGVQKSVAHRASSIEEGQRDRAIRPQTEDPDDGLVTCSSDGLALANGTAWSQKATERPNRTLPRSCQHSGEAIVGVGHLPDDNDAGSMATCRRSAATSVCCNVTKVDAVRLTEVSIPARDGDGDMTAGVRSLRFPHNYHKEQLSRNEHHGCPTTNCFGRNVRGDDEKRDNGVDIVIDSSVKSSLDADTASAAFAGRVAHHIPYSACCRLETNGKPDGDWSIRRENATAAGDETDGARQIVISSDIVGGKQASCRDDAQRGMTLEQASSQRVRLSAPTYVGDVDADLFAGSVSCEDCLMQTSSGDTEKRLNAAVVGLVSGLAERLRQQQQLQQDMTSDDFLESTCPDRTDAADLFADLRNQFVRSSMAIVVDDVRRRTRRLQQRYDRLQKLAELGFDIRVDRRHPTGPATVKKFVMTCRRQSKCGVDDIRGPSSSSCPEEVNVFVLRDGVRIDGLHVSAPESERDCDDGATHVDVAQELGQYDDTEFFKSRSSLSFRALIIVKFLLWEAT